MDFFKLHFVGSEEPTLFQTEFLLGSIRHLAVRGKTSGAFPDSGSFHWSIAVRALSVLAIQTCMASKGHPRDPLIVGEKGSLAASLDYAISKETDWLIDVFGLSEGGVPNFRRVFKRTNSGRKRFGPVAVSFAKPFLEPGAVVIRLNSLELTAMKDLENLLTQVVSVSEVSRCAGNMS